MAGRAETPAGAGPQGPDDGHRPEEVVGQAVDGAPELLLDPVHDHRRVGGDGAGVVGDEEGAALGRDLLEALPLGAEPLRVDGLVERREPAPASAPSDPIRRRRTAAGPPRLVTRRGCGSGTMAVDRFFSPTTGRPLAIGPSYRARAGSARRAAAGGRVRRSTTVPARARAAAARRASRSRPWRARVASRRAGPACSSACDTRLGHERAQHQRAPVGSSQDREDRASCARASGRPRRPGSPARRRRGHRQGAAPGEPTRPSAGPQHVADHGAARRTTAGPGFP